MKVENYFCVWPEDEAKYNRFHEVFSWVAALDAFDYADPEPLAELIGTEPIPLELRPALRAIVSQKRKPNRRAAARLKIPAAERMEIAAGVSTALAIFDFVKHGWVIDADLGRARALDVAASRLRREPVEVLRRWEAKAKWVVENVANQLGVSIETVENLLRDLRKKIRDFPDV